MSHHSARLGKLLAHALAGSWRRTVTPASLSVAELEQVTPLLMGSGAACLGWQRIKDSALLTSPSAELLHQAYRLQSLQSEMQEQKIGRLFHMLNELEIEAVLAKGWAAANIYYNKTLRPYGDIDVCARPRDHKRIKELLDSDEGKDFWIDLHSQFSEIGDRHIDDLFKRSKFLQVGADSVRVLGGEDQLALLCIHFLKHGGWRPLWLCDVAAALESASDSFDWSLCLGTDPIRAEWIKITFALAHQILDAQLDRLPIELQSITSPEWLVDTIYKGWSNPYAAFQPPMNHPVPIAELWRKPGSWLDGLRQRWPNPIIATISIHGKLNNAPRLPYQIANCVSRIVRVIIPSADEAEEH